MTRTNSHFNRVVSKSASFINHLHRHTHMQSPAIQSLEQVLSCSDMDAAAQAAGTLWGLCVDNTPEVKSTLATQGTIRALIKLLSVCLCLCVYMCPSQGIKVQEFIGCARDTITWNDLDLPCNEYQTYWAGGGG